MEDESKKFPERVKEKTARVRLHLKENKRTYILCGATGVVCILGTRTFLRPVINIDFQPVINNMPTFNNHNTVENNLGRVSKIVRDAATGEEWPKMRYLAEKIAAENGISYDSARTRLSQHLHGLSDHVFDKKYEIVGLRTDF